MTTPIVHFEVAGPDEHALHHFYETVFGWTVKAMGPGYALVETPTAPPTERGRS
jgi:predicted enzyme related to lactoylglutathione lyase